MAAVFFLRLLLMAFASFAMAAALAMSSSSSAGNTNNEGLVAREFRLPDGSLATILENRNLDFTPVDSQKDKPIQRDESLPYVPAAAADASYCNKTYPFPYKTYTNLDAATFLDCLNLAEAYEPYGSIKGFWTIDPSKLPGHLVTVATLRTCSFRLFLVGPPEPETVRFDTIDLYYYIRLHRELAVKGRLDIEGWVQCSFNGKKSTTVWSASNEPMAPVLSG
ncbi:hypothetical protein B0T17DRAFT_381486 [Bombardia bombarda]|uniref:Uncharacterized protein n=1 Tax=Bombardia bombarda TaxID=252184 RepID=A0AA39WH43_9PEZI|nr:hypothetical protein B0T17DRAFT_381486 [Bombardia bombarda]